MIFKASLSLQRIMVYVKGKVTNISYEMFLLQVVLFYDLTCHLLFADFNDTTNCDKAYYSKHW